MSLDFKALRGEMSKGEIFKREISKALAYCHLLTPQLHDTGFALESHKVKTLYSLVCLKNFSSWLILTNFAILS
mgnify:CR=1 FL=1